MRGLYIYYLINYLSSCFNWLRCLPRYIVEDRSQPALNLLNAHAFTFSVILNLITLYFGNAEIIAFRMTDIEPRNR